MDEEELSILIEGMRFWKDATFRSLLQGNTENWIEICLACYQSNLNLMLIRLELIEDVEHEE